VQILEPFMLPADRWTAGRRLNAGLLRRQIQKSARVMGLERTILVTTIPSPARIVGAFGESLVVYYCVDDFSEWPGEDRASMLAMERELLGKVDLVIATSEKLFEDHSARHPRVRLLRHGVDWDAFREGRGEAPAKLLEMKRPRIGMTGLIDERIDVPLVEAIARALPEATFVFVGPRSLPVGPLDRLPNVHFLPAVSYRDVPAVLHALDVIVIPYVESRLTERINPLKLRESLASGTPIVMTPLPEARRYEGVLETARDLETWIRLLRKAISEGRTRSTARAARVREESWESRAEEFSRYVTETESQVRPGT
jgi:glycosyltransferase involved in cell wall biosynthesis